MPTAARALCLGAALLAASCTPRPPRMQTRTRPCPAAIGANERPDPGVSIVTKCTYYKVEGTTGGELRAFMNASGPADETGI